MLLVVRVCRLDTHLHGSSPTTYPTPASTGDDPLCLGTLALSPGFIEQMLNRSVSHSGILPLTRWRWLTYPWLQSMEPALASLTHQGIFPAKKSQPLHLRRPLMLRQASGLQSFAAWRLRTDDYMCVAAAVGGNLRLFTLGCCNHDSCA